jgi:zinc transport system substrate-binding protein
MILGAVLACLLSGCSRTTESKQAVSDEKEAGVATVYVVNYPLQYFAQRIGGEHVRVVFPAPPDEDPAFWRPRVETIAEFQEADLILLNGASYEKWTNTVSLPASKTVDTSVSIADQYIKVKEAVTHSHGPGAEHAHTGTAFTIWLDPQLAIAQTEAIEQALTRLRPQQEADFQRNLAELKTDLSELDRSLGESAKDRSDVPLFFSHSVYQYLQRRYSLNAQSVHWEPEEVPSQQNWDELSEMLEQHPAKWMVWEGEPIEENVERLKELGIQSTVFDPCGNAPEEGDFLSVMQGNAENLAEVLGE